MKKLRDSKVAEWLVKQHWLVIAAVPITMFIILALYIWWWALLPLAGAESVGNAYGVNKWLIFITYIVLISQISINETKFNILGPFQFPASVAAMAYSAYLIYDTTPAMQLFLMCIPHVVYVLTTLVKVVKK